MSFPDDIVQSLLERDAREKAFEAMIEQHRRVSSQMLILRDRNRALLNASRSTSDSHGGPGEHNAVRAAYVASLESQIATLRDELTTVYKSQSQNTQRLLTLTESLREAEERSRGEGEQLRDLRSEVEKLTRRVEEARTLRREKEKNIEHLNDELATLQLEFTQLEQRNEHLQSDNKELLQRWLERVQGEASQLNEANAFIEQSRTTHNVSSAGAHGTSPTPSTKR